MAPCFEQLLVFRSSRHSVFLIVVGQVLRISDNLVTQVAELGLNIAYLKNVLFKIRSLISSQLLSYLKLHLSSLFYICICFYLNTAKMPSDSRPLHPEDGIFSVTHATKS